MIASSPRHEMEVHIRMGADENGYCKGNSIFILLSNTGASWRALGLQPVGLSGHKSIALYRHTEAYRLLMMLFTPICRQLALIVLWAAQGILLWSPQQMSWLIRWDGSGKIP